MQIISQCGALSAADVKLRSRLTWDEMADTRAAGDTDARCSTNSDASSSSSDVSDGELAGLDEEELESISARSRTVALSVPGRDGALTGEYSCVSSNIR